MAPGRAGLRGRRVLSAPITERHGSPLSPACRARLPIRWNAVLILTVLKGPDRGKRFELPAEEPQQIGRSSESLPTTDLTISRRHAELTPDDGAWVIRDLDSANGTYVNGVRINSDRKLRPGDQIRTGNTLFLFNQEISDYRRRRLRVAKPNEMDVAVEHTAVSNDESLILAVPSPSEAAVVQLTILYELTQLFGKAMDRQEMLEGVMDLIFEHFAADRGFVLLQDEGEIRPDPVVIRHRNPKADEEHEPMVVSRTIVQHVMTRGEGVLSSNAMTDERFSSGDSVQSAGIRSAVCVPLKFKDRVYGAIQLDSQMANYTFADDQLRLLTAIGVHVGLVLANEQLYRERVQRERLAAVGETVASLSHSIKNILQGMRGGAEVVELGLRKQNLKVLGNGWKIVARNLDRIYELTMNMLAFSKQRQPELEATHLPKLLEEIVELVQRQYDQKQVALITDFEAGMPLAMVDPGGMHQAVLNLLSNALEAVEPESGAVSLSCRYDGERKRAIVQVNDDGCGMSASQLRNLFQPFQSSKGMRGTGLGLVVTKKIVEEHGGTIEVTSERNRGSTFTIALPVAPQRSHHDTQSATSGFPVGDLNDPRQTGPSTGRRLGQVPPSEDDQPG